MTRFTEPVRWLHPSSDAPDELRRLLREGRDAFGPSTEQLDRLGAVIAHIGAAGAAGGVAGGLGHAIAHAVGKSTALKIALLLALGGGLASGTYGVTRAMRASKSTPALAPVLTPASPPVSSAQVRAGPPAGSVAVAPSDDEAASSAPPVVAVPPSSVSAPGPAPTESAAPPTELELLGRARSQLATNPAAALATLDEQRARYPAGTLVQEREVLAIEALVRLGRKDEARARADAFARSFPGSAHLRRISVLLGDDPGAKKVQEPPTAVPK